MLSRYSTNSTNLYTMNSIAEKQDFSPMVKEVNLQNLRKRKKTVSFSDKVDVINVESWKRFNSDMSEESEFNLLRKKAEEYQQQKERVVCSCNII